MRRQHSSRKKEKSAKMLLKSVWSFTTIRGEIGEKVKTEDAGGLGNEEKMSDWWTHHERQIYGGRLLYVDIFEKGKMLVFRRRHLLGVKTFVRVFPSLFGVFPFVFELSRTTRTLNPLQWMREQLPLDTLERNSEAQIMAEIVAEGFYQPLYELLPLHKLSYKLVHLCF